MQGFAQVDRIAVNAVAPDSLGAVWINRMLTVCLTALLVGCSTYGTVENSNKPTLEQKGSYSIETASADPVRGDVTVIVAMSGGGMRASALSYGVMEALRDSPLGEPEAGRTVLDEVDYISAVSGGSFTAAYYGLFGEQLFSDYKEAFLYRPVSKELFSSFLRPKLWFSERGRTEEAIRYYQKHLFENATFADMNRPGAPVVIINATDLGGRSRFSFVQEYFDLLCSDLSSYPVANAVAASSAVPLIFNPVVLRNYSGCSESQLLPLVPPEQVREHNRETVRSLHAYDDKDERQYIHLVDGGLTDNIGLMALYDVVVSKGGGDVWFGRPAVSPKPYVLFLSVDAATTPCLGIEGSNKQPGINQTVSAMTDVQIHRYNNYSKALVKSALEQWSNSMTTAEGRPIQAFFVDINLTNLSSPEKWLFLQEIPTDLSLTREQTDSLIEEGYQQLRFNEDFRAFLDAAGRN